MRIDLPGECAGNEGKRIIHLQDGAREREFESQRGLGGTWGDAQANTRTGGGQLGQDRFKVWRRDDVDRHAIENLA